MEKLTVFSTILLTGTIILTPSVYDRRMCSHVWPFYEIPASKSPGRRNNKDTIIRLDIPVVMFLMMSR